MKWLFIYRRDLVVCYDFVCVWQLFISFKYDFHVDAERRNVRNIWVDGLKRIADICRLRSTKLIFVGYGQLNSTTDLDFLHQACMALAI